jgi:uncharacterized damage-inducible protein DinB
VRRDNVSGDLGGCSAWLAQVAAGAHVGHQWKPILSAMTKSLLEDAFAHHIWATLRVLDACLELSPEQLDTTVPGTYGSILETARHLVGADAGYLFVLTDGRRSEIEEDEEAQMGLRQLRDVMVENEHLWSGLLATRPDPDADVVRHRDDGTDSHAPMGIRLAQALLHGTDHRSQICTALTSLGIEPPEIDVWGFARQDDRLFETPR